MNTSAQPTLVELSPYECWKLLEQPIRVARVVWTSDGTPSIVLVNYAVADGSLWFQTTGESRLARECPGRQVLVEVDSVDAVTRTGWSVVVTGVAESAEGDDVPGILSGLEVWPRGPRPLFVRVAADEVTGRQLRSGV